MDGYLYYDIDSRQFYPEYDDPAPTNADRIRAMSDDDLARIISQNVDCNFYECEARRKGCIAGDNGCMEAWKYWLQSESKDFSKIAQTQK